MNISHCRLINLPKISDSRGSLIPIESLTTIPFEIKRIYYIFNVPENSNRGSHAHAKLQQLFIPISGSFDVIINDGYTTKKIHLSNPEIGLYICPMIWRELENFSSNAVCLVLASLNYDTNDYYRNFETYQRDVKLNKL